MDRVVKSSQFSPNTVSGVGIAVHAMSNHIGLLYHTADGQAAQILHLAWHHQLKSEIPSPTSYPCWVRPIIPLERALTIAAFCRRMWKLCPQNQVPYGFSMPNAFFDPSGTVITGPGKVGLTCASFVLAVFEATGLPLISVEDWPAPTPEDKAKQSELVEKLRETAVSAEHISACEAEIGNVRFRPLDVAGAGTSAVLPASYVYASEVGVKIKDLLDQLTQVA